MKAIRTIVPGMRLTVEDDVANRRHAGRLSISGLTCDRGRVIDLSGTGARIETRFPWREGALRRLSLTGLNKRLNLAARCVWRRREGFMRHMIGVAFEDMSDEEVRDLAEMARAYSVPETRSIAA